MRGKVKLKHGEDYYIKVLLRETTISEIMTPSPVSIKKDDSFKDVPRKFKEFNIRHLPVVDESNKLVGLISQRDLFRVMTPRKTMEGDFFYDEDELNRIILKHVMKKDPFYMHEKDSLGDALIKIVEKKYGCIPVVDENRVLCGIVTQIDILKVALQIYLD